VINYREHESSGFGTEGFIPSVTNMTIEVSEGKLKLDDNIHEYPSFSFDVEADESLNVVYDVYLLDTHEEGSSVIHIDRTELGRESLAFYQENYSMLHCIMTFIVSPKSISLDDTIINVNRVTNID